MRPLKLVLRFLAWVILDPSLRESPPGSPAPFRPPRPRRCPLCRRKQERRGACESCLEEVAAGD